MITIKDITTKELLISLRAFPDWSSEDCEKYRVGCRLAKGGISQAVYATREEILDELALRPHVPGKIESKVIRRLMSKTGQSEQWLRNHPKYGQEIANAQYPNRKVVSAKWAKEFGTRFGSMFGKLFVIQ